MARHAGGPCTWDWFARQKHPDWTPRIDRRMTEWGGQGDVWGVVFIIPSPSWLDPGSRLAETRS
ncbi:MAG: hypothetical protein PUK70_06245 [Bacteroidales bacterium]|nr:hypothetical protein [Bacteroidales bacterium]MDY6001330.1 hypothetical protein [Candidatus Cryptobacteroides sp.]